jgi:histidine kinase
MNARDAIEEKRHPRAETDPAGEEKQDKRIYLRSKRNNDTVVVEVEDTGVGIDASLAGKIFEPFFTTKEVGKGTGIGLSISYGIIKDCNGTITAVPDKTSGACFVVTFPAVLEAESPEKKTNRETGEPAYP